MKNTAATHGAKRWGAWIAWLLVPAAILIFAGANAHLIYVAFASHPGCVQHLKETGPAPGKYRSATSDC